MENIKNKKKPNILLNMEQVDEALQLAFKYLDTIDLSPYLKRFKRKTIRDLINILDQDYPYDDKYSECLFDCITEDEFVQYLNQKYNLNIKKTMISYYYI